MIFFVVSTNCNIIEICKNTTKILRLYDVVNCTLVIGCTSIAVGDPKWYESKLEKLATSLECGEGLVFFSDRYLMVGTFQVKCTEVRVLGNLMSKVVDSRKWIGVKGGESVDRL